MWTDVRLEVPRVPQFPHQLPEPLNELVPLIAAVPFQVPVVLLGEEEVPQRGDMGEGLQDHVAVVVRLDVVKTDDAWDRKDGFNS